MQRIYNVLILIATCAWAAAAYAQSHEDYPVFGTQLSNLSWNTWKWVFLFCFLGSSVRMLMDLKAGKLRHKLSERIVDIVSIFVVGFAAGFLVFVGCEYLNQTADHRYIPDLAICGLMFASAINKEVVFNWVSGKLQAVLTAAAAKTPTK